MCLLPIITLLFLGSIEAIPIDNGVIGAPEVECGPASLGVTFNIQKEFYGRVYVKGQFNRTECRSEGGESGGRSVTGIELPFESCNVARVRSLNPRGIYVTATVVITFHPRFLTKIDRAYRIQCFYMEADKTVSTQIEVSEITTLFQTAVIPMPVCRYEILDGGPTGQPVTTALIGQQVYHKWTCDSETLNTFCAVIHSCFVDDGGGNTVDLLNEEGCALDKYLLNNLEYPTDLMAGQEAHVYKYADKSQLFFQCQVRITIKEPNQECERPACTEPQGFGAKKRPSTVARFLKKRSLSGYDILDTRGELNIIDIEQQNQHEYRNNAMKEIVHLVGAHEAICFQRFLSIFTTLTIIFSLILFSLLLKLLLKL